MILSTLDAIPHSLIFHPKNDIISITHSEILQMNLVTVRSSMTENGLLSFRKATNFKPEV